MARLRDKLDDCYLGPSTAAIVSAATDRRIPHIRLNDGNLVQLGHGARQRRIWTAETDRPARSPRTSPATRTLTKTLLKSGGRAGAEGWSSPEEAWEAALDIGLPVVVKPSDANRPRRDALDLREEDIHAAFHVADKEGSEVLVERFIPGVEHRLLVVGGAWWRPAR